jgi:hypothetical protein
MQLGGNFLSDWLYKQSVNAYQQHKKTPQSATQMNEIGGWVFLPVER